MPWASLRDCHARKKIEVTILILPLFSLINVKRILDERVSFVIFNLSGDRPGFHDCPFNSKYRHFSTKVRIEGPGIDASKLKVPT